MKTTRYDTHLYPSTLERFRKLRKTLRGSDIKITMTKIYKILSLKKEERKKEAAEKDVYLSVLINRDVNEILDRWEKR